jgi:hypothetical protein
LQQSKQTSALKIKTPKKVFTGSKKRQKEPLISREADVVDLTEIKKDI